MPKELDGTYWRIDELAEATGFTYAQIRNIIQDKKYEKLGSIVLVPDDIAQETIQECAKQAGDDKKEFSLSISEVASSLNMGSFVIYQLVQMGLPTITIRYKKRIKKEVYKIIKVVIREYQEQYHCVPRYKISEIYARIMTQITS